jgi:hypothetical protein
MCFIEDGGGAEGRGALNGLNSSSPYDSCSFDSFLVAWGVEGTRRDPAVTDHVLEE